MTRDEFNEILEEIFIEGYNNALEDIEQSILDEESYDLEEEYNNYFIEQVIHERIKEHRKELIRSLVDELKDKGMPQSQINNAVRTSVGMASDSKYINKKKIAQKEVDAVKQLGKALTDQATQGKKGKIIDAIKRKISDHVGSAFVQQQLEPVMKGTVNRFYTKIDDLHDKGEHKKADELEKGFDDDKRSMARKAYKMAIAPKYDKESMAKKILRGDISGATKKAIASKISSLRKKGKQLIRNNGGYAPEKRLTREEKRKIDERETERLDKMKPDNSEEAKQLRKEAEKFTQKKNSNPGGYNSAGYNMVKNAPATKHLPKKVRDILIRQQLDKAQNNADY